VFAGDSAGPDRAAEKRIGDAVAGRIAPVIMSSTSTTFHFIESNFLSALGRGDADKRRRRRSQLRQHS